MTPMFTLKMELANVTVKTIRPIDTVIAHLRFSVQFFGFPGSLGPSNSTRNLCGAGSPVLFVSIPFSTSSVAPLDGSWSSSLFLGVSLLLAIVDWPEGVRTSGVLVAGGSAVADGMANPCNVMLLDQKYWLGAFDLCSNSASTLRVVLVVISGKYVIVSVHQGDDLPQQPLRKHQAMRQLFPRV